MSEKINNGDSEKNNLNNTEKNMDKNVELKKFGKVRSLLFPIYGHELKKLLPLSLIFLAVSMTYTMLRSLKDIFVYTHMKSDSIYFLKILVIPSIVIFTFLYTTDDKKLEHNPYMRFNVVFGYFTGFMLLFTFILLPGLEYLKLNFIADSLNNTFPRLKHLWDIIRVWPISLLYIHAEAYGTMALGVAFWTFANSIFSSVQAKRMYGFLSSGAALGAILSGVTMLKFSKNTNFLFIVAVGSLCFILFVYNVLVSKIKANPVAYEIEDRPQKAKTKVKLSFFESLGRLMRSRYLSFVALIVLGYNMFIALLESIWKSRVDIYKSYVVDDFLIERGFDVGTIAEVATDPHFEQVKKIAKEVGKEATSVIYAWQSICTGLLSLFLIFFVASSMSKKSWKVRALFTPLTALTLSVVFYVFFKKMSLLEPLAKSFDKPLLLIFVLFGMGILVFIKSSKYIFFDTSKEQAYIPLDDESRVTGKAAIDAICSRFGKGLSSIMISVLGVIFGGLSAISNMTFIIIFCVIIVWLFAVVGLSPLYEKKLIERENEKKIAADNGMQK